MSDDALRTTLANIYIALGSASGLTNMELANIGLLELAKESDEETQDICLSLVEACREKQFEPSHGFKWLEEIMEAA